MVAAWWQGKVTTRRLRVLIDGLSPDSAVGRQWEQGQRWGWAELIAWRSLHQLERIEQMFVWLGHKQPHFPRFEPRPWKTTTGAGPLPTQIDPALEEQMHAHLEAMNPHFYEQHDEDEDEGEVEDG